MTRRSPATRGAAAAAALLLALGAADAAQTSDPRQAAIDAFVAQDLGRAEELARAWLAEHAGDAEIHLLLGLVRLSRALEAERDGAATEPGALYEGARAALVEAERLAAGRPLRQLHAALGTIHLAYGEYGEAVERLSRALDERPGDPVLLRQRGRAHLETARLDAAERDAADAARAAPGDAAARLLLAEIAFARGRERGARDGLAAFYDDLAPEPADDRHFRVSYEIGRYSILLNDLAAARDALQRAARLAPRHAQTRAELGRVLFNLGDFDAAERELDALLALDGAGAELRAEALHYKGRVAMQRERPAIARRHFEAALVLAPNRAEVLQHLGAALRRLGQDDAARATLERFGEVVAYENEIHRLRNELLVSPRDAGTRSELVDRLLRLERRDQAGAELRELKRRAPDHPTIPELERRLSEGRDG